MSTARLTIRTHEVKLLTKEGLLSSGIPAAILTHFCNAAKWSGAAFVTCCHNIGSSRRSRSPAVSVASKDRRHLSSSNIVCCERKFKSRYQLPCIEALVLEGRRLAQKNVGSMARARDV